MPLQSVVNTDNGHDINRINENGAETQVARQPRIAAYLTESGTITLTKGSSDSRGYGSKPDSEGDQGNTGGIARFHPLWLRYAGRYYAASGGEPQL